MSDEQFEWMPEDSDWTTDPAIIRGRYCRNRRCWQLATVALNRGLRKPWGVVPSWWVYCDDPDHIYGRRVRFNRVEARMLIGSPRWQRAKALTPA